MTASKAVIVAAGAGRRLAGPVPKQFLMLAGEPLFMHALAAAERASSISGVVLVLPAEHLEEGRRLLGARTRPFGRLSAVVAGGIERQDSVRAGVEACGDCDVLVVHDAARPFAAPELFDAVAAAAAADGAAITATVVADTVKEIEDGGRVARTIDRGRLVLSQTPQAFRRDLLIRALDLAKREGIVASDEAMLVEKLGAAVSIVDGSPMNMKITREEDLAIARAIAEGGARNIRIGLGEDLHPLAPGRRLVLGGVEIPFERGLAGHSDSDALSHAIVDALCGASGLPSIGELFPDTDPAGRGAASIEMVRQVGEALRRDGWRVENLDSVVLCDVPRLLPHIPAMRRALAGALGVPEDRVGIKGKSAEGLGVEGRGEGISARAVALLCRS